MRVAGEAVGSHAIERGSLANSNYAITFTGANLTIVPLAVSVTVDTKTKTYGAVDPALTFTSNPSVGSSLANGDPIIFTGALTRVAGENVSANPYVIQQGSLNNSNYTITYIGANLTIAPLAVLVTVDTKTKTYGAVDPALTFTSIPAVGSSLANGHLINFTGALSRVSGENVSASPYAIQLSTLTNSNYAVTYVGANLSITPLAVTVTADARTKAFGSLDPALTFVSNPSVGSVLSNYQAINFSGSLVRDAGEAVGNYAIRQGSLNNTNYSISYTGTSFSINCSDAAVIQSDFNLGQGGGSTIPIVTKPSGTKSGDVLIVGLMYEKGSTTTVTSPAGWTLIRKTNQGNNIGMVTYYKVAGSSEPFSYTFALSSSPKWSIGISRIIGADAGNPIDTHSGNSGGQSSNVTAPSITTSSCNTLVLTFYTRKRDATWTAPVGTTEVYDYPNTQQGLTSNMMAYYIQSDKGATGNKIATASVSDYWVAQQIAIKSAQIVSGSSSARTSSQPETKVSEVQSGELTISAYPNPIVDRLSIQFPELTKQPPASTIHVFDHVGRSYAVNTIWHTENSSLEIDFYGMNKGLYIIRVHSEQGVQTLKVQKN